MNYNFFQILILTLLLSSCARTHLNGQYVDEKHLTELGQGVKTKTDVIRLIGSPTFIAQNNNDIWYYVSRSIKTNPLSKPYLYEQKIVQFTFNTDAKLVDVQTKVDHKNTNQKLEQEASFTHGKKESSLEHFKKNFGRFNSKREKKR